MRTAQSCGEKRLTNPCGTPVPRTAGSPNLPSRGGSSELYIVYIMRRAASSVGRCLGVVSTPGLKITLARAARHHVGQHGRSLAPFSSVPTGARTNANLAPAFVAAAAPSNRRYLSSKSPSDEQPEVVGSPKAADESSAASEAAPVNTLVSSEGASPSMLTGPKITSKKGYLDRENMIRETQKAIREYYKEGMYQVGGCRFPRCQRRAEVHPLQEFVENEGVEIRNSHDQTSRNQIRSCSSEEWGCLGASPPPQQQQQ